MSEQIVNKIDGIGRNIIKKTTTVERITPNLIAYEQRLHDLENTIGGFDWRISNKVNISDYSDTDILNKIKTVDGTGSGLDSDLLDGHSASYFSPQITTYTKTEVDSLIANSGGGGTSETPESILLKIKTVDGTGSGLDADLLDGHSASYFSPQTTTYTKTEVDSLIGSGGSSETPSSILLKLKTVDGAGSGLDADLLDGRSASYFSSTTHIHDDRYFTETECNTNFLGKTAKAADSNLLDGIDGNYYRGKNYGSNSQDPNLVTYPNILSNHSHTPSSAYYWYITTTFYGNPSSTSNRGQIAVQYNGGSGFAVYARSCYSTNWTPWVKLDNNNIVATEALLAAQATKLQHPRTIDIVGDITANAVAFDGTANIAINAQVNNDSHYHTAGTINMAASHGTNGYVKLATGTYIQWGYGTQTSDTDVNIYFPIAFPTACLNVTSTRYSTHSKYPSHIYRYYRTYFVKSRPDEINSTHSFLWQAIGY